MYRKISAHFVFPGGNKPLKNGIIVLKEDGTIIDLIDSNGFVNEVERLEFYDGIITPGFINAHIHCPQLKTPEKFQTIEDIEFNMSRNGIVAAACTTFLGDNRAMRANSSIRFYTFFEICEKQPWPKDDLVHWLTESLALLKPYGLEGSITPHSAFELAIPEILDLYANDNLCWSLHFKSEAGEPVSNDFNHLEKIPRLLLLHNSFINSNDIMSLSGHKPITFVLCPKAGLQYVKKLPDLDLLKGSTHSLAIGTDNIEANPGSSIFEEMKVLQLNFPQTDLLELMDWGTINGAKALGFERELGSIEIGKRPGLNLIENIDFRNMRLTGSSQIKVLDHNYLRRKS